MITYLTIQQGKTIFLSQHIRVFDVEYISTFLKFINQNVHYLPRRLTTMKGKTIQPI